MTPYEILGLAPDAELLDIKRAYARLLKATRPDDDAVGFQRLEEAYAHCTAIARARQQAAMRAELAGSMPLVAPRIVDAGGDGVPAVAEDPAIDPVALPRHVTRVVSRIGWDDPFPPPTSRRREPVEVLDSEALALLLAQIAEAAATLGGTEFEDWLEANEALFSLDAQVQVARALPAYIIANPSAFDAFYLPLIYDFLVGAGSPREEFRDPMLARAWQLAHANSRSAAELATLRASDLTPWEKLALADLLDAPDRRRRAFLHRFPFARAEVEAMLATLLPIERGREAMRADAAEFWLPSRGRWRGLELLEPLAWTFGSAAIMALLIVRARDFHPPWFTWLGLVGVLAVVAFLVAGRLAAHALLHRPPGCAAPVPAGPDIAGVLTCLLTVPALLASTAQAAWPDSGFAPSPLAIIAGVFASGTLMFASRFRYEVLMLCVALTYALMRGLAAFVDGPRVVEDAMTGLAFAGAPLLAWGLDRANAHWRGLSIAQTRKELSLPALALAIAVWTIAYYA